MKAASGALIRTFKVGGYECTLTFPKTAQGQVLSMTAEWDPQVPDRLTPDELDQYRAGRDAAVAEMAQILGGNALVLE